MNDMKRMPEDKDKMSDPSPDGDDYPYGLQIHLTEVELKKLGLSKLPTVGDKVNVSGIAKFTSASTSASESGGSQSCSLQITHLSLGKHQEGPAETLYGKK